MVVLLEEVLRKPEHVTQVVVCSPFNPEPHCCTHERPKSPVDWPRFCDLDLIHVPRLKSMPSLVWYVCVRGAERERDRDRERERQRDTHTHTHTHTEGG